MPGLNKSFLFVCFYFMKKIKTPELDSLMQVRVVEKSHKSGLMLCMSPEWVSQLPSGWIKGRLTGKE